MSTDSSPLKTKVLREIERVPEENLAEVYDLIHHFRLRLESSASRAKSDPQTIMNFAGSWQDWSDAEFAQFLDEIQERRQQAFSGRPERGTGID